MTIQDLVAVAIRTSSDGPFSEDVFWQFLTEHGFFEETGLDPGDVGSHLPGFDYEKVVAAMACTSDRIFRVWHRDESPSRPTPEARLARLTALLHRLDAKHDPEPHARALLAAWSRPERLYHDLEHLDDCLREVDREPPTFERDLVELALVYHDAVYEPGRTDSEAKSAAWLRRDATALVIDVAAAETAAALVEATAHATTEPTSELAKVVTDIDLSILGRDPLRFMEYEHAVEEEYAAVPKKAFFDGRKRFLEKLLERPIFRTTRFRERFEERARKNVGALLRSARYAND